MGLSASGLVLSLLILVLGLFFLGWGFGLFGGVLALLGVAGVVITLAAASSGRRALFDRYDDQPDPAADGSHGRPALATGRRGDGERTADVAQRLRNLEALRAEGLITEAERRRRRKEILADV